MNADLKRVRGDSTLPDGPLPAAKRRALSLSSPPPLDNSEDDRIEDWMKVVEAQRKEAIYRRMLEYRRSFEREMKRANEIEAQKRVLEASVHAVEICWTQLVQAVQDMAGRNELEVKDEEVCEPILDPQMSQQDLGKALQTRLPHTRRLIHRFTELASSKGIRSAASEELQSRCMKLQAEASSLRSHSHMLQTQLSSSTDLQDTVHRDLMRAQKALDRQRMQHDKAELAWRETRDRDKEAESSGPSKTANGSGHATPNGKVDEDVKPDMGNGIGPSSTVILQDTSELEELAASRLQQLGALRTDLTGLQQENDRLRLLAHHPSEAILRDSPFFQVYLQQLTFHVDRANQLQQRFDTTDKTLDALRNSNGDFHEAVLAEARTETDGLRQQLAKRDTDLARLRGQRDDMNAELLERRAKEGDKVKHAEQLEALAKARQDRITFLSSEVRRLKGKLAAEDGADGYLAFLKGDGGIDGDYIKDLESKLDQAQDRISSLASQLESAPREFTAATSETQDRMELEAARRALAKYERILGPHPEGTDDVRHLGEQLAKSETQRTALELKLSEAEAATNALYSEVEGLSKLWEGLEQAVHSKVFELKDGELRVSRLTTEKAKADNKYFQAMRAKEGIEAECRTAQRSVEKQLKMLDRASEVEKNLNAQIVANDRGLTAMKNSALELQTKLSSVTSEKLQIEDRLQQSQLSLTEAQQVMHQRVADATSEKTTRERLQEEAESSARTIKKLKERQEALAAAGSNNVTANEWQMKEERDKLLKLLRCSCCEQNFKQQVIVKCMHTFCKQCLQSRIASRQRKCPACGLTFAKEDVQTLYWQ